MPFVLLPLSVAGRGLGGGVFDGARASLLAAKMRVEQSACQARGQGQGPGIREQGAESRVRSTKYAGPKSAMRCASLRTRYFVLWTLLPDPG